MNKLQAYILDVRKEMEKVNWPSRQQLIDNTLVTLIGTIIASLIIWGADQAINALLRIVYGA